MRHITYKGRVVYEREKHLFTEKDIKRITRRLVDRSGRKMGWFQKFLRDFQIWLLTLAMDVFGAGALAPLVYDSIENQVYWFMRTLGFEQPSEASRLLEHVKKLGENLSQQLIAKGLLNLP